VATIGLTAGVSRAVAAAQTQSASSGLQSAFELLIGALNRGDLTVFLDGLRQDVIVIDEDAPVRMNREQWLDHLSFHGPKNWESFGWIPGGLQVREFGDTGYVVGHATFRGKPRDAGFRLRHLQFAQGWRREQGVWRVWSWHLSPVLGHVTDASPG
jgi:ketosteroid isomerase-like protein